MAALPPEDEIHSGAWVQEGEARGERTLADVRADSGIPEDGEFDADTLNRYIEQLESQIRADAMLLASNRIPEIRRPRA